MCGRFSLARADTDKLAERFHAAPYPMNLEPHYNLAPSQETISIVHWQNQRQIVPMKWGLIPYWNQKKPKPYPLINVRSESLIEKPIFKPYFEKQRCLIPADGFFEWRTEGASKIPFRAVLKNENVFAFAGLWEKIDLPDGKVQVCFTIITTEANSLVYPIHDRMPVILAKDAEEEWLNPSQHNTQELIKFLKPYPADQMKVYEVSREVNSPRHDSPECIFPHNKHSA